MQLVHRFAPIPCEDFRQYAEGEVDAGIQQFLLSTWGAAEDEVGNHAAVPGMADAKPQAVKTVLIAELGDDVAQPVVATGGARSPQANSPERQVDVVGHHEEVARHVDIGLAQRGEVGYQP